MLCVASGKNCLHTVDPNLADPSSAVMSISAFFLQQRLFFREPMADFLLEKSRRSGSQRKIEPTAAVLKDVNSAQISPVLPVVAY